MAKSALSCESWTHSDYFRSTPRLWYAGKSHWFYFKQTDGSTDWQAIEITYGLYLSDHSILGPVETELVVLAGIMMQNVASATGWHLRGMRRIGVSAEDLDKIQQCVSVISLCQMTAI